MIFVDTSAWYALADRADANHDQAQNVFSRLCANGDELITHNYIIVESAALMQHRLGFDVAEKFLTDVSSFRVVWVDQALHDAAVRLFCETRKRAISFVDCMSFALMRKRALTHAFAFDDDFKTFGFTTLA